MFNKNERQFIYRLSTGLVWSIFSDSRNRLCACLLGRRNVWNEPLPLSKDQIYGYCSSLDTDDRIHLAYQSSDGGLYYILFDPKQSPLETRTPILVLESRIKKPSDKFLSISILNNDVHLFFIVKNNDINLLSHIAFYNGILSKPEAIDYIGESKTPYLLLGSYSNPTLVYLAATDDASLKIRHLFHHKHQIDQASTVPYSSKTIDFIGFQATNGDIYLVIKRKLDDKKENDTIHFIEKRKDSPDWSQPLNITSTIPSTEQAGIYFTKKFPILFCLENDYFLYREINPEIELNQPMERLTLGYGRHLISIGFRSNFSTEKDCFYGDYLPAAFINGFRVALYKEPAHHKSEDSSSLPQLLLESFELLKEELSELEKKYMLLESELIKLDKNYSYLQIEQTKLETLIKQNKKNLNENM